MAYQYKHILILIIALSSWSLSFTQSHHHPDSSKSFSDEEINIAFDTQSPENVTSAVSVVRGADLRKTFTPNLANSLYGRLSGLMVEQRGNEPGSDSPGLYVRGINSFGGAGTAPIIIVDGVESSMEQLVPYEIESITLLKDASATAVFGNRGANGALLVTTKRGTEGELSVDFTVQGGFQQATRLPEFLNSYEYANLFNEGLVNDGAEPAYSEGDLNKYQTGSDPYLYPDVDWYDQVLKSSAPIANYNLNFSGGDETVRYFTSLNALTNGGLYRNSGDLSENSLNANYEKYNVRTNVDIQLTQRISASLGLGGSVQEKSTPAANTTNDIFNMMSVLPPNAFPVYNPDGSYGGNSLYTNPLGDVLESGFFTSSGRTLQSTFRLDGELDQITPGLSISSAVSYHTSFVSYSNKTREYERYDISEDEMGQISYTRFGQNTQLEGDEDESDQWQNLTFQTFFNYQRDYDDFSMDAMLMFHYKNFTIIGPSEYYPIEGSVFPYENMGVSGRYTSTLKEKYIGEISIGYHGSENFAKGNRFGIFPAVSLGWIVSREDFFTGGNAVDFLKLRGSFGIVGNENVGGERFMYEPTFRGSSGYYFGGSNTYDGGIVQGRSANPDFTWEKDQQINMGVEAIVFGHLNISMDYFNRKRTDILVPAYTEIPAFIGIEYPFLNVGKVRSSGLDAELEFNPNSSGDFGYFVRTNFWFAKNEIEYNAELPQREEYLYRSGQVVNQPFLLEALGFFSDKMDIESSPKQVFTEVQPGDIKYKDQNGDGVVDNADFYPIGKRSVPEFNLGLTSGFSYRGFYLDCMVQAVTGRSVYLDGNYYHAFQNDAKVSSIALGRWQPGSSGTATYPRLSASNNENNFQPSSFWQRNGSFLKLRSLELGYRFPDTISEKLKMELFEIFINGSNLFSLDHLTYSDPETLSGYPAMRTISLGANIQF